MAGPIVKVQCAREGCHKTVNPRYEGNTDYCRILCRLVDEQLIAAQNVCQQYNGHGEMWAAAVALSDALSEFDWQDHQALVTARSSGLSAYEYRALKSGSLDTG